MKQFTLLMIVACSFVPRLSGQTIISLHTDKMPVVEVLKMIETQSAYTFSYNPALFSSFPPVSLKISEAPVSKVLTLLFENSNVQYIIRSNHIILKEQPKRVTISGYIYDAKSHETLIAANVFDVNSQRGAVSNNFGFYSIMVPPTETKLRASYVGYDNHEKTIIAIKDTVIDFYLNPATQLEEIIVEGRQNSQVSSTETGKITLNAQTLQAMPSLLGEKDVIKTLQLLPGVAMGTEGMAGLYVRGGNLDENLYLVDGNPLYHVNHLGGMFSTFNPEAVKTMDFYKGSFPARYGGRLSSVVDVRMNDGSPRDFSGTVSIGLISSRIHLEGPVIKDKTSYSVSLRRTYLDAILRPALYDMGKKDQKHNPDNYEKPDPGYYFYDFNAKISHRFSDKSRLFVSMYDGKDKLFLDMDSKQNWKGKYEPTSLLTYHNHSEQQVDFDMDWGTRMVSANWAYAINSRLFSNATLIYSKYASDISAITNDISTTTTTHDITGEAEMNRYKKYNETTYGSGIQDAGYRLEFDYTPTNNHYIRFGTSLLHHTFKPEESRIMSVYEDSNEKTNDTTTFANERLRVKELALYAEDEISINPKFKINAGLHLSGFMVENKNYFTLQPRISARYLFSDNWSVKTSYGKMSQYVHLLQSTHASLPNDLWVPITKNVKPMVSHQVSGGIFKNWKGFEVSLESYYKTSKNQVEYKDGAQLLLNNLNWEERIAQGLSKSYGAEIMAKKVHGNTSGWISYTLSWTNRHFPKGEINNGNPYPAKYDNRHKINTVVMHKINKKFDVSASWIYSTGNWATLALQSYVEGNGSEHQYISSRNNFKMPNYQRLDLNFNYYRFKKNGRMGIWNLSIYNVYSHHNSFIIQPTWEWIDREMIPVYKSTSIFPIIPSFSYTYKF